MATETSERAETAGDHVRGWAAREPDRPALLAEGRTPMTYGHLAVLIDQFRQALNDAGLGRGDRVAVMHSGGAGMAASFLGLIDAVTVVTLNPHSPADELTAQICGRGVRALVAEADHESPAPAVAEGLGLPVHWIVGGDKSVSGASVLKATATGAAAKPGLSGAGDIAFVLATSGTAGRPKIVPVRHRHFVARGKALITLYQLTPEDRGFMLQPLYYSSGLSNISNTVISGSSMIVMGDFEVGRFFHLLESLGPTWYGGSYTFQMRIHAQAERYRESVAKSRLRFFRTMSGHLDEDIGKDLARIFGVPIYESYGSTEAGRVSGQPLPWAPSRPGTVGRIFGCDAAILGPDDTPLSEGEAGEIVVKGPCVFDGYEGDPEANAESFVDGWYRTGDEGFIDGDGYLTLTGRIKEMINRGGEKFRPDEVDEALLAHPEVREAGTYARPHPTLGEVPVAVAVLEPGASSNPEELRRFVLGRLAGHKVPLRIDIVDEIPKGPTGKVQRHLLGDLVDRTSERR